MPDGRPLYQHLVDILGTVCPKAPTVFMSLAQESLIDDHLRHRAASTDDLAGRGYKDNLNTPNLKVIVDMDPNNQQDSAGPAAGLLAAHQHSPDSIWLVIACDYPFLTSAALQQLVSMYQPPVTCFANSEGFCEPLVAIWSPEALAHLASNCAQGSMGPSKVVRQLKGRQIAPEKGSEMVLYNANTRAEWDVVLDKLKEF